MLARCRVAGQRALAGQVAVGKQLVPVRFKQSKTSRIGIPKPSTLAMHDMTVRPSKGRAPVPLVAGDNPAVAEHAPSGTNAPAEDAPFRSFAAVRVGGKQYKVTEGDVLVIDRLKGAEVGTTVAWEDVMLVGSATRTVVGRPFVPGARVEAAVEQQTYAAKVPVFKKKRRKGYKRFNTFRRPITVLRIASVDCAEVAPSAE